MGTADATLVTVARPSLAVDGNVDAALAGRLVELSVEEDLQGPCQCEAVFNNWGTSGSAKSPGFLYFGRDTLDFGKRFEVRLGDADAFDGRITALRGRFARGDAQVGIMAEDRLQELRMTRRSRTFERVDDATVMRRIAQEHGLSANIDLPGPTHTVLAQLNQSDLAFLHERSRALGAEIWLSGTTLNAVMRNARGSTSLSLTQDVDLFDFTVTADLSGQASKVVSTGWDVGAKKAIREEGGPDLLAGEVANDQSGADILATAFKPCTCTLAHTVPHSAEEARALAKAQFLRSARRFIVGRGTAVADPRLKVGANVMLQGVGALFNGRYYIVRTRLRFDSRAGLRIEFTCERAGLGRP